jgi:predicted deacylase
MKSKSFKLHRTVIEPGTRKRLHIKMAKLYDFTDMHIPVEVIHGTTKGPVLLISAAVHGDELNGVEIIKRLLMYLKDFPLTGTLIAVPIVNVFGFNNRSRYFLDRRELNRNFPGTKSGPLASKLAYLFRRELVQKSDYIVDLHTAAVHRTNMPQIRLCFEDSHLLPLAKAFGAPLILNSPLIQGSLRKTCSKVGIPLLVYEAGEALRFDDHAIQVGFQGVLSLMAHLGMIPSNPYPPDIYADHPHEPLIACSSHWTRAPESGILTTTSRMGQTVTKDDVIGYITDPFGDHRLGVRAESTGVVVGESTLPLVNKGDALFHIAQLQ